ncbi:unnamed protein product, partial [Polarella glacialis]
VHIARTMFKEVHTPSHTQLVRKMALDTTHTFLDEWREEVSQLGPTLGEGINAAIEEERDPRNLIASFAIARQLLEDCPASCVNEETLVALFESITSYFPITFSPPKDDKVGITGPDLRRGLMQALSATDRLAEHVLPFLLDQTKDIDSDSEDSVKQALEMLSFCFERYGPKVTQGFLKDLLDTTRDQVCRTNTTCEAEFSDTVRQGLRVALKGVPAGLHPHWLSKDLLPAVKILAEDASKGQTSLACRGSRRLLLAMADAHGILLEIVWSAVVPLLLTAPAGSSEGTAPALPKDALSFVLELSQLAKKGSLAQKQLKQALAGALEALCGILPGDTAAGQADEADLTVSELLEAAVKLVAQLSQLAGETDSADAFRALRLAIVPYSDGSPAGRGDAWGNAWRAELSEDAKLSESAATIVTAVCDVASVQPGRAAELAPALLDPAASASSSSWMPAALPRLLATASLSLARGADQAKEGEEASKLTETAASLVARAAALLQERSPSGRAEVFSAFATALDGSASAPASAWAASRLASELKLPAELPGLVQGLSANSSLAVVNLRAFAARCFVRALSTHLPAAEALALRLR